MAHAILSPSGAERWLNCTPSARLEEKMPDTSGEAAQEGTLAHSLAETMLRKELKLISKKQYDAKVKEIEADPLYNDAMWEYCEQYATFVMEQYNEALSHTPDALIFIEKKLNLTAYVPEGFGTGDAVIIADSLLYQIDLKYGKGVPVAAQDNKQMKLYSLGSLKEFSRLYDLHTVRMTIYQPRIDNISTFEISADELLSWAEDELMPKAKMAFAGEGEFVVGKHCQFCKVKAQCRALRDHNLEIAKMEFKEPPLLQPHEISEVLDRTKQIAGWLDAVNEFAFDQAVNHGVRWPGYKLVEGRSNRKITDPKQVVDVLVKAGFEPEPLYKPVELQGLTFLEKHVGKARFNDLAGPFIDKPPGKPALVAESDKRPELNSADSAARDFADVE